MDCFFKSQTKLYKVTFFKKESGLNYLNIFQNRILKLDLSSLIGLGMSKSYFFMDLYNQPKLILFLRTQFLLRIKQLRRFSVKIKCTICKVLESDQWNWLPINHWSLLRTLQIPLFQIPTTSKPKSSLKSSKKSMTNSIVWDLKKS